MGAASEKAGVLGGLSPGVCLRRTDHIRNSTKIHRAKQHKNQVYGHKMCVCPRKVHCHTTVTGNQFHKSKFLKKSSARFGVGRARSALGRHVKDEHVKDAAQDVAEDVAEDVPQGVAQDLPFGTWAVRILLATPPSPPPPSLCSSR